MAGDKKTLKNWKINNLHVGISALSGRMEFAKDKDGKNIGDKPVNVPYKFGDNKVHYAIGKTDAACSEVIATLETAQKTVIRLHYPDGAPKDEEGRPDTSKCDLELNQIANDESEITIFMIDENLLNANENGISPQIIGMLAPMLKD